jgi:hypothetical protein
VFDPRDEDSFPGHAILDHIAGIAERDGDLPKVGLWTRVASLGVIRQRVDSAGDRLDGSPRRIRAFLGEKGFKT